MAATPKKRSVLYLNERLQNWSDVILIPSPFTLYGTGYFYNPENVKNLSRFHQSELSVLLVSFPKMLNLPTKMGHLSRKSGD
jgi:hypothetical protein